LIGTGCGVPGIMSSRTIENVSDRRMTVITTTFIPCSAKLPLVALIASVLFDGAWWVAPSAYFLGIAAILLSGIMLKKTKLFSSDVSPFVMELPAYHMPTFSALMRSMWERGWSFIKRAGTVILLSAVIIWAGSCFGTDVNGVWGFFTEIPDGGKSVLDMVGSAIAWLFKPLGFGTSTAAVATVMGLVAKEEIVAVFGVLDFGGMTALAGYSFLAFNLLCAPCFAAMGAIRREMNSAKWTAFAITYQCVFAYAVSLMIYQFGMFFGGEVNIFGILSAVAVAILMVYMLVRKPYKK
ncbi:MAG: ferrous iron transporter B, partial [Clostridia bacterium]|nr:ferrous iron transporter B [Clostridia bacterium]